MPVKLRLLGPSLDAQFIAIRRRIDKNVRFGTARGLTQTAKQISAKIAADLPTTFDRPNPFTQRGIGFTPANTATLTAMVFVKDAQAAYLLRQETGGTRLAKTGDPVNLPVNQKTNQYGNIGKGVIGRLKQKPGAFVADGKGKTAHLQPGIYQRPKRGKRRDGSTGTMGALRHGGMGKAIGGRAATGAIGLKLLVSFQKQARYRPRFKFVDSVKAQARATLPENIRRSIDDAMRTAR